MLSISFINLELYMYEYFHQLSKQYKNREIPVEEYPAFLEKFTELVDGDSGYLQCPPIPSLFQQVILSLPNSLKNQAQNIYKKILILRRGVGLRSDNESLMFYFDILEKRFPEFSRGREEGVQFLFEVFCETKVDFFLNKSKEKIQKFSRDFPNLYMYFIKPLYDLSSKPLSIFFMVEDGLFRFINGQNIPFFHDIEKILSIMIAKSNEGALKAISQEMFKSTSSMNDFAGKYEGFLGELTTARSIFAEYGESVYLKKLTENGNCDYECKLDQTLCLVESKAKSAGHGCKGNESILNDFFINHIFRLHSFFNFVCPEFCENHRIQMSHFGGYEGVVYNEYVNHIARIRKDFPEILSKKGRTREQEIQIVYSIISKLYDQPIPISFGRYIPPEKEQIEYVLTLADNITRNKFCENLLKEGSAQLTKTGTNRKACSRKILHIFWLGYLNMLDNPLFGEQVGSVGSKRFRENLRQILNTCKKGSEIELWISDGNTLHKL